MNTKRADTMLTEVMNANRSHYVKLDRNAVNAILADRVELSNTVRSQGNTINTLTDKVNELTSRNEKLAEKVNELSGT